MKCQRCGSCDFFPTIAHDLRRCRVCGECYGAPELLAHFVTNDFDMAREACFNFGIETAADDPVYLALLYRRCVVRSVREWFAAWGAQDGPDAPALLFQACSGKAQWACRVADHWHVLGPRVEQYSMHNRQATIRLVHNCASLWDKEYAALVAQLPAPTYAVIPASANLHCP